MKRVKQGHIVQYVIILCLLVATVAATSKYVTSEQKEDKAYIAMPILEITNFNKTELEDIYPDMPVETVYFNVKNYTSEGTEQTLISDVPLKYKMKIVNTEETVSDKKINLTYRLYKKVAGQTEEEITMNGDTTNDWIELNYSEIETQQYTLEVYWNETEVDSSFAGINNKIDIEFEVEQSQ